MLFEEFKKRCYEEFDYKHPNAETIGVILANIPMPILLFRHIYLNAGDEGFWWQFIPVIIKVFIIAFIIYAIYRCVVYALPRKIVKQAKRDKSYMNYPSSYPYSFLYPGEPFPFDRKDVPPINATAASAPAASPTPAPVRESTPAPAQPEQVTITCGECGQPMLIPSNSGTVKITCPKCGNSFIHTN